MHTKPATAGLAGRERYPPLLRRPPPSLPQVAAVTPFLLAIAQASAGCHPAVGIQVSDPHPRAADLILKPSVKHHAGQGLGGGEGLIPAASSCGDGGRLPSIFVAAFRAVRQPDTIAFFHPTRGPAGAPSRGHGHPWEIRHGRGCGIWASALCRRRTAERISCCCRHTRTPPFAFPFF